MSRLSFQKNSDGRRPHNLKQEQRTRTWLLFMPFRVAERSSDANSTNFATILGPYFLYIKYEHLTIIDHTKTQTIFFAKF